MGIHKKHDELEKKYEALQKKYDELCRMDCQKLYGNEVIKRERAEQQAEEYKAKAEAFEEMTRITNAWITTLVEIAGEVVVPSDALKNNLESGIQALVTYDHEADAYRMKMPEKEKCVQE